MALLHARPKLRLILVLLAGLAAYAGIRAALAPRTGPAFFEDKDCAVRRLSIGASGDFVGGAEDLSLTGDGSAVLVSAYDRLAVEAALKGGEAPPSGGVYRVALSALFEGDATAEPVLAATPRRPARPHGLAIEGGRMALINRRAGADRTQAVLEVYDVSPDGRALELRQARRGSQYCAANDVAFLADRLLVTLDRAKCPGWAFDERVLGLAKGAVGRLPLFDAEAPLRRVKGGLAFANGLVVLSDGRVVVAETRGRRLRLIDLDGGSRRVRAPGAPDNLSFGPEGEVVAALQPSLMMFGLYRYGRRDRAASRIAAWSPGGDWRLLYEDKTGRTFSGATSAVFTGDALIAGSVRDDGLLVCHRDAP